MKTHCPIAKKEPKKSFITPDIWQLRSEKLHHQRKLRQLKYQLTQELLHRCFAAWRGHLDEPGLQASEQFAHTLQTQGVHRGIQLWRTNKQLKQALAQAKRRAVKKAIEALPSDSAASHILNSLKPVIGSTNLKAKRATPLPQVLHEDGSVCEGPVALRDRWIQFFGAMEGGERTPMSQLREAWIQQLQHFMQTELQLQASDIPTLTDLEAAFRRVKDHKAVGEDQIPPELCHHFPTSLARLAFGQLLKLCSHGQEALFHKGGVLVAAWKKKGPQILCESYRSLLISSHIAKSVHRAVRDHQSTVYEAFLQSAQIGGRKSIPVSLGVHYIRAAARRARNLGRSHALVFLDLREAFYRVLRPISIGGTSSTYAPSITSPAHEHTLPHGGPRRSSSHSHRQSPWRPIC